MDTKTLPYVIPLSKQQPRPLTLVPEDIGSRYKVRQIQIQSVGKNKMTKTVLVNILDVAKDMQLPHPSYLVMFLGYELSVTPHFFENKPPRQQAVLSGHHEAGEMSFYVQKFIDTFLLCPECGLPELLYGVKGNRIAGKCRGCGTVSPITLDNEKFHRFVINHPPQRADNAFQGNKTGGKTGPMTKQERRQAKLKKQREEAKKKQKQEQRAAVASAEDNSDSEEEGGDVEWFSDVSEEAVQARLKENVPDLILAEQAAAIDPKELKAIFKEANPVAAVAEFKSSNVMEDTVFVGLLFDAIYSDLSEKTPATVAAAAKERLDVLSKFVASSDAAQRRWLGKVEELVVTDSALLKSSPVVLQQFYNLDVTEEESILAWHKNDCKNKDVKVAVAPFIAWLEDASEESSSEE